MKPNKNKRLTHEMILMLCLALAWNQLVYNGSRLITGSMNHYDMTTAVDELVPFCPWTVLIYFGSYLFWYANYCICAKQEKKERDHYFCADMLAKCICFIFFILLPTTNIRPEITGSSVWDSLMKLLYSIDAADNLFPSIHCLVSWLCWIGVRKRKDISATYRYFSLFAAISICISTLTTRQHVIYDVVSGIAIAEACYLIADHPRIYGVYSALIERLKKLFKIKDIPQTHNALNE